MAEVDVSHIPDQFEDGRGGYFKLLETDKLTLAAVDAYSDDELEQCHYIMTPQPSDNAEKEMEDLLRYLNMDKRVYTIMYGYYCHLMEKRNRERNSLKRANPTKRGWRRPEL